MVLNEIKLSSRHGEYHLVFDFGSESYCFRFNEGADVKEVGKVVEYGGFEIFMLLEKLRKRAKVMSREELEDIYIKNGGA